VNAQRDSDIDSSVVVPPEAAARFRERLGLPPEVVPRVAFLAGPGDVARTFDHWLAGENDPRVPVITYSTMFYALIVKLRAEALVLSEPPDGPLGRHPQFRFVPVPFSRPDGLLNRLRVNARYSRRVMREIGAFDPHVVLMGIDVPPSLYYRLGRRRIVLTVHNTFWPMGRKSFDLRSRIYRGLLRLSFRRVAAGVHTSAECARQVESLAPRGTGLFVETPQIPQAFLTPPAAADRVERLLFLGRIEDNKGVFDLLDAFDALAARHPALRLDLAGTGSAADRLRARIAASPHRDRLRYLGQLSGRQVHEALAETDALVCPTRSAFREGLALVVIEAAAHGVPTVLSSVVPARDLMQGACVTFEADDAQALQAALAGIIDDPAGFRRLRAAVATRRDLFQNRAESWGSQLYRAFVA
jgi:glycogen(starch) synthase